MKYETIVKTLKEQGNCYIGSSKINDDDLQKLEKDVGKSLKIEPTSFDENEKVIWVKNDKSK